MNKTLFALGVMLAFVGTAMAQQVGVVGSPTFGYMGDEPNTPESGTLPYVNHATDNTVNTYMADNNNIGDALAGIPSTILGARFYQRDYVLGSVRTHYDHNLLLAPFIGDSLLTVPQTGHFLAWHGVWSDTNGDGWITDPTLTGNTYVPVGSSRGCAGWGTVDTATPAVQTSCGDADEWTGTADATIVGYITPHVPVESYPPNSLGAKQTRDPDFTFEDASAAEAGRYYTPSSNWDVVFVDNSLLETTAVEVISSPATTLDGPRSRVPGASSLVDTDVYRAVDPTVEAVYQTTIGDKIDLDHPEQSLFPDDGDDALSNYADVAVGPVGATFFKAHQSEDTTGFDLAPHVWFDAWIAYADHVPLVYSSSDSDYFEASHTGGPDPQGPIYAGIYGWMGVWHDKDSDGWIGNPEPSPGCPDVYDCGDDDEPHEYGSASAEAQAEWTGKCSDNGAKNNEIFAIVSSSDGVWGGRGVYLTTDRFEIQDAPDFDDDNYDDGRVPFNPYDDAVWDVTDGSVDAYVASGPVTLHLVCSSPAGYYTSYEKMVFPGSNLGFDLTFETVPVTVDFTSAGVATPETVSDTDTVAAW